jgi:hypothetical protein
LYTFLTIICETIAVSYAPLKSTVALILNWMCIKHRSAQFVYFILFQCLFHWNQLLLSSPVLVLATRGAEDLASRQYKPAVFTVRRILLLSSAIPVPASSRQYERAEAVVLTVPALFIQQRVLQDLQTITQFSRSAPKREHEPRTLLK